MASWNEVRALVNERFKFEELNDGLLKLIFDLGGGRSQLVFVTRLNNSSTGEEWVGISSPVGKVGEVSIEAAARKAWDVLCGGIVVIGDLVHLHHSTPMVNLDTNEFMRPLQIIVQHADEIERTLGGGDTF